MQLQSITTTSQINYNQLQPPAMKLQSPARSITIKYNHLPDQLQLITTTSLITYKIAGKYYKVIVIEGIGIIHNGLSVLAYIL